nr:DUF2513 domain-containing protein [uncultured Draconibacterium sp.]
MKRDIELIKKILLHFENKADWHYEKDLEIEGFDSNMVSYNLQLMYEAGLINAEAITSKTGRIYDLLPFRLTWEGHEFLDNIKDESRWAKMKKIIFSKGGNFSIALIKQLAIKLAEEKLLNG